MAVVWKGLVSRVPYSVETGMQYAIKEPLTLWQTIGLLGYRPELVDRDHAFGHCRPDGSLKRSCNVFVIRN